jgi:hypothetical protein
MEGDIQGSAALVNINIDGKLVSIDPGNNLTWNTETNFKRSTDAIINGEFGKRDGAAVYYNSGYAYIAGGVSTSYGVDSNGKLIPNGQSFNNQIWQSQNGIQWKRLVDAQGIDIKLPWSNIEWPCAVNDNQGRTWLIGGYNYITQRNVSDVWVTSDGINWNRYIDNIDPSQVSALFPRHATACIFDDINSRLISIAGKGGEDPDNGHSSVTNNIVAIPINMN